MSAASHIAHISIGWLKYPLEDPRNAEVLENLDRLYGDAEASDGYVWRKPDEEVFAELAELGRDPAEIVSVSVWSSVDALRDYTFKGLHRQFMDRAREWFEEVEPPTLALWPVAADARPTVAEALERLAHLKEHGPTEQSFGWDGPAAG